MLRRFNFLTKSFLETMRLLLCRQPRKQAVRHHQKRSDDEDILPRRLPQPHPVLKHLPFTCCDAAGRVVFGDAEGGIVFLTDRGLKRARKFDAHEHRTIVIIVQSLIFSSRNRTLF